MIDDYIVIVFYSDFEIEETKNDCWFVEWLKENDRN